MRRDVAQPLDAGRLHRNAWVESLRDGMRDDGLALLFQQLNKAPLLGDQRVDLGGLMIQKASNPLLLGLWWNRYIELRQIRLEQVWHPHSAFNSVDCGIHIAALEQAVQETARQTRAWADYRDGAVDGRSFREISNNVHYTESRTVFGEQHVSHLKHYLGRFDISTFANVVNLIKVDGAALDVRSSEENVPVIDILLRLESFPPEPRTALRAYVGETPHPE
jgi:hypothetical protein